MLLALKSNLSRINRLSNRSDNFLSPSSAEAVKIVHVYSSVIRCRVVFNLEDYAKYVLID